MNVHSAPLPFRTPRCGFTLIELLTVIAIVGILAAILIPVVGSARITAQSAQTVSNLHQIQAGDLLYAADNKGFFVGNDPFGGGQQYSQPWFSYAPFAAYAGGVNSNYGTGGNQVPNAWDVGYPEVFKTGRKVSLAAPPRDDRQFTIAMNMTGWTHTQAGAPVGSRWSCFGDWSSGKIKQSLIVSPSSYIMFYEAGNYKGYMYDRTTWVSDDAGINDGMAFRNKGRCNVVFADGHVASLTKDDITPDNTLTNKYFWWDGNVN